MSIQDWRFNRDKKQWEYQVADATVLHIVNSLGGGPCWIAFYNTQRVGSEFKDEQLAMREVELTHEKATAIPPGL